MTQAASAKLNSGYISRSYAILKLAVSSFAQLFLGHVEGLTRFSPRSKCYMSYDSIAESFGVSTRQAKRVVKKLGELGVLEQVYDPKKQGCAYYRAKTKNEQRGFVSTPLYLHEKVFTFEYLIDPQTGKKPKAKVDKSKCEKVTFARTLTDIEVTVLSLMAAHGTFDGTVTSIANTIGKSRTSAQKAIDGLLHCAAIHRSEDETSQSRRDKSTYHVDEELLEEIKTAIEQVKQKTPKQEPKEAPIAPIAPKSSQKTAFQKEIADADARSRYERYYSLLREKAQKKAERVNQALNSNDIYKKAYREDRSLEIALVKAENNPKERRRIVKRKNALKMIMKNIARVMGYELADREPQYRCGRCNDTGYKKSGVMCTCYPK